MKGSFAAKKLKEKVSDNEELYLPNEGNLSLLIWVCSWYIMSL